ncbi:hypothetical protein ACFU99_15235, partial [Streptomyces sp. NPDC057654]|uniref:hypothetical protein n=1 Tax=Streptomyces sp. NPDC057654 TaxID=3346196 RepID=UPI0036BF4628
AEGGEAVSCVGAGGATRTMSAMTGGPGGTLISQTRDAGILESGNHGMLISREVEEVFKTPRLFRLDILIPLF